MVIGPVAAAMKSMTVRSTWWLLAKPSVNSDEPASRSASIGSRSLTAACSMA